MLETSPVTRSFSFNKRVLPDPNPKLSPATGERPLRHAVARVGLGSHRGSGTQARPAGLHLRETGGHQGVSDDDVLARAAVIVAQRREVRSARVRGGSTPSTPVNERANPTTSLSRRRCCPPKPSSCSFASDHYRVEAECPNGNRWHGDAICTHHARGSAITLMAASRLELLWALWATVSDQDGDR